MASHDGLLDDGTLHVKLALVALVWLGISLAH
jgi:hypothetical protein